LAKALSFKYIIDVGANVGDWSILAGGLHPNARIYSFEIAQPTFHVLSERIRQNERITALNLGLSDQAGLITIQYIPQHSGASTGLGVEFEYDGNNLKTEKLEARVTTGDLFLQDSGIREVDFLKVDVEGMEGHVLRGFTEALRLQRIKVIQFEYGLWNIVSKFLLRDYHHFFKDFGYMVGKLYPRYVDFSPYMFNRENLIGSNYVAIPEKLVALRTSLESRM
jgi:FkbM family methyltransferase